MRNAEMWFVMADTLTIKDNRTGRTAEVPIHDGTMRATDLRVLKARDYVPLDERSLRAV